MSERTYNRRMFLKGSTLAGAALITYSFADFRAQAATGRRRDFAGDFDYRVVRSEDDWQAMLNDEEYRILRQGGTERPKSSPLWKEKRAGAYHCKGCDQKLYDSAWKKQLNKGWVFFFHSEQNAVLTSIDPTPNYDGNESNKALIEVHCSRCGSHQGHLLKVTGKVLHCINGKAMTFYPREAA